MPITSYKIKANKGKRNSNTRVIDSKKQVSEKVLLVTGSTGLGFNYAPHFGMYQILEYLLKKV